MDKKEILEKSRKENLIHDEGAMDTRRKGQQVGIAGFMFLVAVVIIYNLVVGIDSTLPVAFLLGYSTCQAWGEYAMRREKITLISGIIGIIGTIAALGIYVVSTLP